MNTAINNHISPRGPDEDSYKLKHNRFTDAHTVASNNRSLSESTVSSLYLMNELLWKSAWRRDPAVNRWTRDVKRSTHLHCPALLINQTKLAALWTMLRFYNRAHPLNRLTVFISDEREKQWMIEMLPNVHKWSTSVSLASQLPVEAIRGAAAPYVCI